MSAPNTDQSLPTQRPASPSAGGSPAAPADDIRPATLYVTGPYVPRPLKVGDRVMVVGRGRGTGEVGRITKVGGNRFAPWERQFTVLLDSGVTVTKAPHLVKRSVY